MLDEDEFSLLHEQFMPKNPNFSYEEYDRFSLYEMNDAECLAEFRFRKHDLQILSEVLQIPDSFRCYQRNVVDGMEGLCILLRRLSYPCRYSDMISRFGLPVPVLSMVSNDVLDFIYNTHRHRITQWNHNVLNPAALQIYSNAIADKGAALHNCFRFVDGTVRPVCRPGEHQRVIYNGHKRVHALKFQCVALPNGLMFMLQFLKYAEDMNSQVFAELPTSTVVSETSLLEETLLAELHLGANISETWPDFIPLTFSYLNKAFER